MAATTPNSDTQIVAEPIAVIGSACRFPGGSHSPSKLWELLSQPRDVLREFSPDRLNLKRFYHPNGETHGSTDVANVSYILEEDPGLFDASFFSISPLEAAGMDPQQRILLETVYEAAEAAGISLEELRGSLTSVHVGVMTNDWAHIQRRDPEMMPQYTATAVASSIISNRISYVFDLKGASETVDTACSSSLVALHNAARALQSGDCHTAIVGGVNLILDPDPYIFESKLHMLSPDSRSRMWDKDANGYARGEGSAVVILKPLRTALRDGDHIEGVIRSTFVNSDGHSSAGLDPVRDRPQFFECHGTGTKAGDPVEARAISDAFIPTGVHGNATVTIKEPLYVGSIKSVIGHLEGCAGLAGVMKALLSIKHRTIPPNLWFDELSPEVAPFYGPLQVPTTALPWPDLPAGAPLRVSVNSFGFGGTNAHAIIESYEGSAAHEKQTENSVHQLPQGQEDVPAGPLLFSAKTRTALLRSIDAHALYLRNQPGVCLRNLSRLLHEKRSTHDHRAHFSGASRDALLTSMESFVRTHFESITESQVGHSPRLINPRERPGILGVFTGQGAQWAAMGKELIFRSSLFGKIIKECEACLQDLPEQDAPSWSLSEHLTADTSDSRLSEAEVSQPLCTAVQLALVNLLRASGVHFDAVVGHSSGEIAAVYASGIISLRAAMQIAYYRGRYAKLAGSSQGHRGSMMAAGLSMDDALKFCHQHGLHNRIQVAASNAPQSVTLSGDDDAIQEAKDILDANNVFARKLKVDTAYHSHHMMPCAQPYLESLLACDIKVHRPEPGKCVWSSSVRGDAELVRGETNLESLKGPYWVANMVQTVLFSRAVEAAIWHGGPFDLAIEVGPHPALKGPTEQTLRAVYGSVPLYTGVLKRGTDDVEAFSTALGAVWSQLGPDFIDLSGYQATFCGIEERQSLPLLVIKDLPSYSWDHDKSYWLESRISRRYRTSNDAAHELLGRRVSDDNVREARWRNVLKVSELPWTQGHKVLGEVLLPGASYISMALEAGRALAVERGRPIELLEVSNVDIMRPVVVPDNKAGVETSFTVRLIEDIGPANDKNGSCTLRASFSFYFFSNSASGSAIHTCSGDIAVHLRAPFEDQVKDHLPLPPRGPIPPALLDIDCERLYSLFESIGLDYSGVFRRIKTASRRLGYAAATATWADDSVNSLYVVHPAILDVAFQSMFIARAHPNSGQISSALLPSRIESVRVKPSPMLTGESEGKTVISTEFEAWVLDQTSTSLTGDINVYDSDTGGPLLSVEGFEVRTVGEQDAIHDRLIFSKTVWGPDLSTAACLPQIERDTASDAAVSAVAETSERASLFYVKMLMKELNSQDRARALWYHQRMLDSFDQHLAKAESGLHPHLRKEWLLDQWADIEALDGQYGNSVELQMIHAVGVNMASVVRGEMHMLEVMRVDDLLDRFYAEDQGMHQVNYFLAEAMKKITFKYPRCRILEIGAGTGATSWTVLSALDDAFDTYTYTDLSAGFFGDAAKKFSDFQRKMVFKTLDIEKEPLRQGYDAHSYDIIIAANVLHATADLNRTLRNVASILKPGGYLVLHEKTGPESLRATFNFGGLEGWWLAEEEERRFSPLLSPLSWDIQLQNAGFSGADYVMHDIPDETKQQGSLIVSQLINDSFLSLCEPLSFRTELPPLQEPLLIIGGKSLATSRAIQEIGRLLPAQWKRNLRVIKSLDGLEADNLGLGWSVICIHEVDEPLFAVPMSTKRLGAIQGLLMRTESLLWVTSSQITKAPVPRAGMFRGIARVMEGEIPQLHVQVLGLEPGIPPTVGARHLIQAFLRLKKKSEQQFEDGTGTPHSSAVLWSHETEMEILADGQAMIPRVKLDSALNETHIASTRTITKAVDSSEVPVQVAKGAAKLTLQVASDELGVSPAATSAGQIRIHVHYAVPLPGPADNDCMYLVCGHSDKSADDSCVIAMSAVNASIVCVASEDALAINAEHVTPEVILSASERINLQSIKSLVKTIDKPSVLVYDPEKHLADSISREVARCGGRAFFASPYSQSGDFPKDWLKIYATSSKFAVKKLVPHGLDIFLDCSTSIESAAGSKLLRSCIPKTCAVWQLGKSFIQWAFKNDPGILCHGYSFARDSLLTKGRSDVQAIPVAALADQSISSLMHERYVVDWRSQGMVLASIPALETKKLFKSNRTYLMVGAAGGVGTSICHWMLRNGARYLVITSRNPKGDPVILEEARRYGASVHIEPMDVCSKDSVQGVVDLIRQSMPPIAGVCNAAMVLHDRLFLDMSPDQLNNTLGPKVDGSEHLDAILADESLDFFVLLGSAATVVNNVGQSNYHCANLFMDSIVARRRSRGLAASIIHIGYVCDTGYVARNINDQQIQSQRELMRQMTLGETDVHYAFAQAIRGGSPGSTSGSHNIIMGIEPPTHLHQSTRKQASWLSDPRLGHMLPLSSLQGQREPAQHDSAATSGSVRQQVEKAQTEEEAISAVLQALCSKLESILLLPLGSIEKSMTERPIIDLGIDSLVAVQIRTWLLKELGVEIPVVKILGGDTVKQLCTSATKLMAINTGKPSGPTDSDSLPTIDRGIEPLGKTQPERNDDSGPQSGNSESSETDNEGQSSTPVSGSKDSSSIDELLPSTETGSRLPITELDTGSKRELNAADENIPSQASPEVTFEARMSPAQARIWFLSKHMAHPAAYNMVFHYRVRGPLQLPRLRHAMMVVAHHHDCLRMCFYSRPGDGQAMQGLMASPVVDIKHISDTDGSGVREELQKLRTRTWNIDAGQTLGLVVISQKNKPEEHSLLFGYHHIVMDAIGWHIFMNDLDRAYRMQVLEANPANSHLTYSEMQFQDETTGAWEESLAYWEKEFRTLPEVIPLLPMAADVSRQTGPDMMSGEASHHVFRELDQVRFRAIVEACQQLRISPFHLHIAVLQVLLAQLTGSEDVCIGIVDSNRSDDRFARMVGCLVNMLPVRFCVSAKATLADTAKLASRKALEAFANGSVPLGKILDRIKAPRPPGTTPLFQAALNYRGNANMSWDMTLGSDCRLELVPYDVKDAENPFDLSVLVTEMSHGGCAVELYCQEAFYTHEACEVLLESYLCVLDSFVSSPAQHVSDCVLFNPGRVDRAIELGKGSVVDFHWPGLLSQRVLDTCRLHPGKPAIIQGDSELLYGKLLTKIKAVARAVVGAGCMSGDRIAVLCSPSIDAVIAMLAIIHLGAVYVPLATSLPIARHEAMVASSKPKLILCHEETEEQARSLSCDGTKPLRVDQTADHEQDTNIHDNLIPSGEDPDSPAILLYTSGSTGVPKGVLLSQANFANHIALKTHILNLGCSDRVLQQSSLGFDMSVVQTFCALANGGCLVLVPEDARRDPVELTSLIRRHGITLTIATPTEYLSWLRYGGTSLGENASWRYACMGGEPISQALKDDMRRLNIEGLSLINCYGPTEITAAASFQTISPSGDDECSKGKWGRYAVGSMLPNYSVRIVDVMGRAMPAEHTGEIAIGGAGVALGYLNMAEETREKFVLHDGQRFYRTGDLGRLLADGTLLCLGRVAGDSQVKLRGLRIELQEVEDALIQASGGQLSAAVVSRRGNILVAHASPAEQASIRNEGLRAILGQLAKRLPQYSIPAVIIIIPNLPMTANGKLNRRAVAGLPVPEGEINQAATGMVQEKMTIREGELRLLWEKVLPKEAVAMASHINPSSDFFLCGGNSLLLMKLQAAIREELGISISTRVLYRSSTLREMSRCLMEQRELQDDESDYEIDWDLEAAVPDFLDEQVNSLLTMTPSSPQLTKREGLEVLLTGATGFLGGALLRSLLSSPAVHKVHCVAVGAEEEHLLDGVQGPGGTAHGKAKCYVGSLSVPNLGLSAAEIKGLGLTVDVIIHAGANGHCLNTYSTLRMPNVVSTHCLASMALTRPGSPIPFIFLSSNRVALLSGSTSPSPGSVARCAPTTGGREGHTASKWVSEVFLERLCASLQQRHQGRKGHWLVSVHRPCVLVSEHAPNSDALNAILRFSVSMRCVPWLPEEKARGYLDFGQVDKVVEEIRDVALQAPAEAEATVGGGEESAASVRFRHHSGGLKVPMHEFRLHMEAVYGGHFDQVDLRTWIGRAADAGMDPLISAYLEGILEDDAPMVFPFLGEE